jgi:hypothetical protein
MTANAMKAGMVAMIGARMNTTRSAALGMMSSFSASLMPSARLCSRPNGPTRLGPIRCCMRATTRRSHQIVNRVMTTRKTKTNNALPSTSHQGSAPNPGTSGAASSVEVTRHPRH